MSKGKTSLVVKQDRNGVIKQVQKVDLFLKEFLSNGGNATEAAMTVFKMDNRSSAAVVGSRYLKEAKSTARVYMEKKGFTYGKLLELAMEKAMASKNTEWFDRLMKLGGYEDFMSKGTSGVNVNILTAGNQKDTFKGFVEEGEVLEGEILGVGEIDEDSGEDEDDEEIILDPTISSLIGEDNESN
jgi:hypothetical protein